MAKQGSYLTKIILSFAIPGFLGIILVAAFLNSKLTELALERWGHEHQRVAQAIAMNIDRELASAVSRLEAAAKTPVFDSLPFPEKIDRSINGLPPTLEAGKRMALDKLLLGEDAFSLAFILLPNGDHYISHPFSVQKNLKRYNLGARPYFQKATKTKQTVISDGFIGADGIPAVAIDTPLMTPDGTIFGHLGGVYHLPRIKALVGQYIDTPFEEWAIIGKDGEPIAQAAPIGEKDARFDEVLKRLGDSKKHVENGLDSHRFLINVANAPPQRSDETIAVATTLENGWKMIFMRRTDSISATVRGDVINSTLLVAFLLFSLSAIGIAYAVNIGRKWAAAEARVREANDALSLKVHEQTLDLRASEQRYRTLIESAEVSILEEDFSTVFNELKELRKSGISDLKAHLKSNIDEAWRLARAVKIIDVNEATLEMFGVSDKKAAQDSVAKFFSENSIKLFIDELVAIWEGKDTFRAESAQKRSDGTEFHILLSLPVPRTEEEALSVPVSMLDITKLKLHEASLAKANRSLQMLSDCSQTINRARDEITMLGRICSHVTRIGGYRLAWVGLKGQDYSVIPVAQAGVGGNTDTGSGLDYLKSVTIRWDDSEAGNGPAGRAIRTGTAVAANDLLSDPDYAHFSDQARRRGFASSVALPLKLESGEVLGALNVYSNRPYAFSADEIDLLTKVVNNTAFGMNDLRTDAAQKAAESRLRDSEARFRSISMSSSIAMVLATDEEGTIISWNPAAEKSFGYCEEEILGQHLTILMPKRFQAAHKAGFERARTSETFKLIGKTVELTAVNKNGEEFPIELSLGSWREGKKVYFSGVIHDISERKQLERRLSMAQKMESVGQLSGGIAHDFNNLLGIIQGNLELISTIAKDDEKVIKRVEPAMRATKRGAELTNRLLSFSRQRAQTLKVTSANNTLDRARGLIEKSLTFAITITMKKQDDLWLTRVDPGDFENALINLSLNARDAMQGSGTLTIETFNTTVSEAMARTIPDGDAGDYVQINVSDTGSGIPADVAARIFEPFFSTKSESKGSGLGLSMVYGFVKRSGGFIDLISSEGEGTTFQIFLPRSSQTVEETADVDQTSETLPIGTERVLIVDDEVDLLDIASQELDSLGYKVATAQSGTEALDILDKEKDIALVLSDIVMPGDCDGYDIAFQTLRRYPGTRIILMSGYTSRIAEQRKKKDPVLNFLLDRLLPKPFSKDKLAMAVRAALDGHIAIQWSEEYATGIDPVDEDHRVLVSLFNKLFECVENKQAFGGIRNTVQGVIDYTTYHFRREEAIMAACDYPHLENHKKVHSMMLEKVSTIAADLEQSGPEAVGEFIGYLKTWLVDHIMAMDKSILPFTNGKEREINLALEELEGITKK